jgi:signal transduction histidine kinase
VIARIGIRTRLAAVSALLAGGLLVAAMSAVFLIERRSAEGRLTHNARAAVMALQAAVDRAPDEGPGPYLRARAGADELLYVDAPSGVITNRPEAAALASRGSGRTDIKGRRYEVARIDRGDLLAVAAVTTADADDEMASLLRTLLKIGASGLVLTLELAWFAAYRALRPLQRMADRAAEVTAGEPGARVGEPASRRDEIGRLGAAIDEMLNRLEVAYAAQRRFVHDASHELRTPLTIARGHLEVLVLDPDPPPDETRAVVALAVSEIDRVDRLVTSLLSLARLEDSGVALREPIPLEALLQNAAIRGMGLGSREFTVTVTPPDLVYAADRDALDSVLLNLVSNAVRYTDEGGRIDLEARRLDSEVELVVSDDGAGIPGELLPVLFDRFTRADPARGRETGGSGLGLAICRAVVESHGGTIEALSPPEGGARFVIRLPAHEHPAGSPPKNALIPVSPPSRIGLP